MTSPVLGGRSQVVKSAYWVTLLFGVALIVLAFVDWIWDNDPNAIWRWVTVITGVVEILLAVAFYNNPRNVLIAVVLLVVTLFGGFLTWWTIAGGIWSLLGVVLVGVSIARRNRLLDNA